MSAQRRTDLLGEDQGFTSAAFATLVFGFALIAAAGVMLATQELRRARRDIRDDQEAYVLAGVAVAAAVKLLGQSGMPTLRWSESSQFGPLLVTLEPEALKMAPPALSRADNDWLLTQFLGADERAVISQATASLEPAPDGMVHRAQIVALGSSLKWRDCATTLVSPYSRLTSFALPGPVDPETLPHSEDRHAGELWRIAVDAPDGAWIDQVVRMTGSSKEPFSVIDADKGKRAGNERVHCLAELKQLAGGAP